MVKGTVMMEEMSWVEIGQALRNGTENVILVSGSMEQHGPHLPLATDTILGQVLSKKIAEKLGKTLVAPVLRPGVSFHHMGFPGTISFSPELLIRMIDESCTCLARHGFKKIILMSSHGGNFTTVDAASVQITESLREKGFNVKLIPYVNLGRFMKLFNAYIAEKFGLTSPEAIAHADITETSIILTARPDLVDMTKAERGYVGEMSQLGDRIFVEGLKSVTPNGILGDPTRATREMGEGALEYITTTAAQELRTRL